MQAAIHELRNHLSVAMCNIEAFLDRKLEPSDVRLNAVWQALHEVDRIIDDLPGGPTVEFGTHVVSIDVCRLIANHVTAMEGFAAERGVRLTTQACDMTHADCAQFLGDPVRIAEIITNVLLNAINFTPPSGEVRTERVLALVRRLHVAHDQNGNRTRPHDPFGYAADEEMLEPAPSVTADHDKIRVPIGRGLDDLGCWVALDESAVRLDAEALCAIEGGREEIARGGLQRAQHRPRVVSEGRCFAQEISGRDDVAEHEPGTFAIGKREGDARCGIGGIGVVDCNDDAPERLPMTMRSL